MRARSIAVASLMIITLPASVLAAEAYQPPVNEYGQPDLQGVWSLRSLTPLERPDSLKNLVISAEEAEAYIQSIHAIIFDDLSDPDSELQNVSELTQIRGELRSSAIYDPPDGRMPFTELGLKIEEQSRQRDLTLFDHPEQRLLDERCLGSLVFPPFRPFVSDIPRRIVQTEDYVLIYSEDPSGARIIHLTEDRLSNINPSFAGYSTGTWQEDTLIIETSGFRADEPARLVFGRSLLVGAQSKVIERLSLISAEEILYQFSVEDPNFYTMTWRGEFIFQRDINVSYEYSCHEGNYSMPGILRGGQMEQARIAAESAVAN
jgi:hypothetical protein